MADANKPTPAAFVNLTAQTVEDGQVGILVRRADICAVHRTMIPTTGKVGTLIALAGGHAWRVHEPIEFVMSQLA